jgi:transposase
MSMAGANPDAWAVGFEDECWWSRLALPALSSWAEEGNPKRLLVQQSLAKDDPEPKAISSCYGLYLPELDETWLRFVNGRPVSSITTRFLGWCCEKLEAAGKKVLLLIWDNASWHVYKEVRRWLGKHNRKVKQSGEGARIMSCRVPKQSPWLNAIEPKWIHGKRKVVSSPTVCWEHTSLPRGCVGSSVVLITSISPFHGRSFDHALDSAHHRFLAAVKSLAQVRRLQSNTPGLQINTQINLPPQARSEDRP